MLSSSVSLHLSVLITMSLAAETCYEGPGGASPTEARARDHIIKGTRAMISKPAPDFSGTAVVNGEFTKIKLSNFFKGSLELRCVPCISYLPLSLNYYFVNVRLWPAL